MCNMPSTLPGLMEGRLTPRSKMAYIFAGRGADLGRKGGWGHEWVPWLFLKPSQALISCAACLAVITGDVIDWPPASAASALLVLSQTWFFLDRMQMQMQTQAQTHVQKFACSGNFCCFR